MLKNILAWFRRLFTVSPARRQYRPGKPRLTRYELREGKGGKYNRYWIWDKQDRKSYRNQLSKPDAVTLLRQLNSKASYR